MRAQCAPGARAGRARGLLPARARRASDAAEARARRAGLRAAGAPAPRAGAPCSSPSRRARRLGAATLVERAHRRAHRQRPTTSSRAGRCDHGHDDHGHDRAPTTHDAPDLSAQPVTIAWVGDMVLASTYGTPPDGGRALDGARRRAAARRRPHVRQPRGDALAAARHQVRRLAELLRVPGAAVVRAKLMPRPASTS